MLSESIKRRTIGITMGDAAGIGPEVVVKALAGNDQSSGINYKIIGDETHLRRVANLFGLSGVLDSDIVEIDDLGNLPTEIKYGADSATNGRAAADYIERSVELWREGDIDAVATAPISKRSLEMAGVKFPGHTEFLAHLTNTEKFAMSFFANKLRVVLLSTHLPLVKAIELVKTERLVDLIDFANGTLSKLLHRPVKIAVAGLNPHASEGGMFGTEEAEEIVPAIEHCRSDLQIDVSGPYSPDTIFLRCSQGEFDAVIALYHDQATIPVKSIAFNAGVNVTLGLPLVRTSVDHGTAYDIAGQGIAQAASMRAAIGLAAELVSNSQPAGAI